MDKTKELIKNSISFIFLVKDDDREKIEHTLNYIFSNKKIGKLIGFGTTKFVYEYTENFVFKIIILDLNNMSRFLSEPLVMLEEKYTNKPINIIVYVSKKLVKNDCNFFTIHDIDIGDNVIITWYEEKAKYAELRNFPDELKLIGKKFIKETTPYFKKKGFTDLGEVNIGWFDTFPNIRWYDIQPKETTKVKCIK